MKKFLKIILWLFAITGVLALLGLGGFAFFIYKNVNRYVMNYTCNEFNQDLNNLFNEKELEKMSEMQGKMSSLGISIMIMQYGIVRGGMDFIDKEHKELRKVDEATWIQYGNELASICDMKHGFNLLVLLKDMKGTEVPPEAKILVEGILREVSVTSHPKAELFSKIMAKGLNERVQMMKDVSSSLSLISDTQMVTTTNPKQ